jgi:tRNA (cmo5U34)-methyltransferase
MDVSLPTGAEVLIVGAGGGREIEALAPSDKAYRLTGVDPSGDML